MVAFQSFLYSGTELLSGAEFKLCCPLVDKYCPTLCDPMDCNMPGSSVLHHLLHYLLALILLSCDAVQPSHRLLPTSPPTLILSQLEGLFH